MKNPLNRRLPRELKRDFGKYTVLFVFIAGMIAIVSGFIVAGSSMTKAYDESFEKYCIEDGNFEISGTASTGLINALERKDVSVYENFYVEEKTKEADSTLRIFKIRNKINKACIMSGRLPETRTEIAIDRMYADNNGLSVGDTLTVGGKRMTVTGLIALSDYSALFSNPQSLMFDAVKFGVAVTTEQGFKSFGESHLHYSYSWKYAIPPKDDAAAKSAADGLLELLIKNAAVINFTPQYVNPAITFTGNDIGRDRKMITFFLYIVVAIIAFVFAITTSSTVAKEASVIGTLRASGYSRRELIRHYMAVPMLVTLAAAVAGNILGYTLLKDFAADMYYSSYSLPTFVTVRSGWAFVSTTVIPLIIMFLINFSILSCKLSLSPLKFLRRDLKRRQKKRAVRLSSKIGFIKRFRLRVIFQNMPNYVTVFIGIFLANFILLFGLTTPQLLDKYQEDITSNMICEYQYILKSPVETKTPGAERMCAGTLSTIEDKLKSEEVTVFGISGDKYIGLPFDSESVYISNAYAEKYGIKAGDTVTLREKYVAKDHSFTVKGIYYYPPSVAVFMDADMFRDVFGLDSDYFTGYFSSREITDIDDSFIAASVTTDDLTKVSRQLKLSLGGLTSIFLVFGVSMFMLIIYLLSKIVIEKNAQSISMIKILGYTNREISRLYIASTTAVVMFSLVVSMPAANALMRLVFTAMFSEYPGWLPYYAPVSVFVQMAILGICSYVVIAFIQMRQLRKIPLGTALKNAE